ncbi:LysR family transcriptional regulator [Marinobacterium aestuariivivens]|uniref:LysR family transcriptional regulator n=1 Tax=Marinobacterium aestuariivivens TaxID=1698799 RepID=A0ABW2A0W9_9GAMM
MDWNGLKSFLAIAESGSLSGAARELGVNHSTMFRRLQAYEAELGGRLFDKIDNRYVLTPLGEGLLEQGRQIAARFDEIERRLVGKDVQPKGRVRITAPYNIANRFLPQALGPCARPIRRS